MKKFIRLLLGLLKLPPQNTMDVQSVQSVAAPLPAGVEGVDARSLRMIRTLDPKFQPRAIDFLLAAKVEARKHGCDYVIISGTRTWAEQDALYAQGRTKPGRVVTKARAGQSNHNFGIAFDCGVFRAGQYLDDVNPRVASLVHGACGLIAKRYGLAWGGTWKFKDEPHYQLGGVPASPTEPMRVAYKSKGSVMA